MIRPVLATTHDLDLGSTAPSKALAAASNGDVDRIGSTWDCRHAQNELVQAMGGVYLGFGTMTATSETIVGVVVGAGMTLAAIADVGMKIDASNHACQTGPYVQP